MIERNYSEFSIDRIIDEIEIYKRDIKINTESLNYAKNQKKRLIEEYNKKAIKQSLPLYDDINLDIIGHNNLMESLRKLGEKFQEKSTNTKTFKTIVENCVVKAYKLYEEYHLSGSNGIQKEFKIVIDDFTYDVYLSIFWKNEKYFDINIEGTNNDYHAFKSGVKYEK